MIVIKSLAEFYIDVEINKWLITFIWKYKKKKTHKNHQNNLEQQEKDG